LYHGLWLALHRALPLPRFLGRPSFRPLCMAGTFLLVCVGWMFFRAQTFADAGLILTRLAWPTSGLALGPTSAALVLLCLGLILAGGLVGFHLPLRRIERRLPASLMGASLAGMLLLVLVLFPENSKAFIYFQF
jgi:hypothetical protein